MSLPILALINVNFSPFLFPGLGSLPKGSTMVINLEQLFINLLKLK